MPRRLSISISTDGSISAEASGTPGPDCLDALDQLRAMLQAEIESSRPTPEFYGSARMTQPVDDVHHLEDRA